MIQIREAAEPDYRAIIRLMQNELGYPDLDDTEAVKRLDYFRNSDDWETFVAILEDEIAGFIGVMKSMAYNIEGHYSQIMALAVSEKVKRHGVGTALVKRVEEWVISHGITNITVNSNKRRLDAHAFYDKNGYIKQVEKSFSFAKSFS